MTDDNWEHEFEEVMRDISFNDQVDAIERKASTAKGLERLRLARQQRKLLGIVSQEDIEDHIDALTPIILLVANDSHISHG
jgi:hypothetical protein